MMLLAIFEIWIILFTVLLPQLLGVKQKEKKKSSTRTKTLPDLNLPSQKNEYLFYSTESKARRIGTKLFEKGNYSTLEEAIEQSKEIISKRKKQQNLTFKQKRKNNGIKLKDYHKSDYHNQENRIKRAAKKILEDDKNDIKDPKIANEMAEKFIKQRSREYYHNRAQKRKTEKKVQQTGFHSQ